MANEAVIIELGINGGKPMRYTVASGTAITKGTLMKYADSRLASASTGTGDVFAGIATMDKSATDFTTTASVYTDGIFDLVSSGAITAGALVATSGANQVRAAVAGDILTGSIVGKALETATAQPETIAVKLGLL